MKALVFGASTLALTAAIGAPALAQQAAAPALVQQAPPETVSEIVVTGTRTAGVKAADSAAPVQVVGAPALTKTGATDLATILTSAVPSLNINANGGDQAGLSIQAALRGLNPNDTLVLINGKRRHTTSDLAVDGGNPYSGSAAVDLSFIPEGAIDHIEVLTDGAAAQYGSDAIAGVVNIFLKKQSDGGQFVGLGGQDYDGQGLGGSISLNKGLSLGDNGYVNVTLEERYQSYTAQGIGDFRFQNPNGTLLSSLTYPNSNIGQAANFPQENRAEGTPQFNIYNAIYNGAYSINSDVEFYFFGSYGRRDAFHYGSYRPPTQVVGKTSTGVTYYPLPYGFDPAQSIRETDFSFTEGFRGNVFGWHYDLSNTYGEDQNPIYVIDSANAQLFPVLAAQSATQIAAQRNFYNGAFTDTESTTTLDFNRNFDVGLASPLNVAFGGEYRDDSFTIGAGEPSSYYGAGSQSYDGLTPLDAGSHSRDDYAGYVDLAVNPVKALHVDLAGRYERYSDFGSDAVGKFTGRYDFSPEFAIRGTISSGFRAPTLEEEYYSGTNVSVTSATIQLPPNSSAAQLAGFQPLKPEQSVNYSLGFVAHPIARLQITADAYNIQISNRITPTSFIYGSDGTTVVSQGVLNAIAARGVTVDPTVAFAGISLFTNAATTTTTGVDVTANYSTDLESYGRIDWTLGFNYNHTKIDKINSLPAAVTSTSALAKQLGQYPGAPILGPSAVSALTTETPEEKAIVQALWTRGRWSVNVRSTIYSPVSKNVILNANNQLYTLTVGTTAVFDLDVAYRLTDHLKFDVGANNLFNEIPPAAPNIAGRPANNTPVFGVPIDGGQGGFSPFPLTGGLYYGRVTYTF